MLALKKTHCWIQPLDTHTTPHIPPYRAIFILICCDHRFLHSDCNAIRFHLFMHIEWEHFFFFFYSWLHSLFRFGVKTFDVFYIHLCILLTICLRSAFISEIYFYSEFGFSHVVGVLLAMLMMIRFFSGSISSYFCFWVCLFSHSLLRCWCCSFGRKFTCSCRKPKTNVDIWRLFPKTSRKAH